MPRLLWRVLCRPAGVTGPIKAKNSSSGQAAGTCSCYVLLRLIVQPILCILRTPYTDSEVGGLSELLRVTESPNSMFRRTPPNVLPSSEPCCGVVSAEAGTILCMNTVRRTYIRHIRRYVTVSGRQVKPTPQQAMLFSGRRMNSKEGVSMPLIACHGAK